MNIIIYYYYYIYIYIYQYMFIYIYIFFFVYYNNITLHTREEYTQRTSDMSGTTNALEMIRGRRPEIAMLADLYIS